MSENSQINDSEGASGRPLSVVCVVFAPGISDLWLLRS